MKTKKEVKKVKITERGYAGHFCGASNCMFRRNTLIEYGDKRIVVSTVGNYRPRLNEKLKKEDQEIGINRFYETMAFEAKKEGVYWEADVSKQVDFNNRWTINELEQETDFKADEMHERIVKELSLKLPLSRRGNK